MYRCYRLKTMSRRNNIAYIKPEEPAFIRDLKKQAGIDDRNHKFDELQNNEEDFAEDDDSEQPQVVVLKPGDLTAEQADKEKKRIEDAEKSDLSKVRFIPKKTIDVSENKKRKKDDSVKIKAKKSKPVLSFDVDDADEDDL